MNEYIFHFKIASSVQDLQWWWWQYKMQLQNVHCATRRSCLTYLCQSMTVLSIITYHTIRFCPVKPFELCSSLEKLEQSLISDYYRTRTTCLPIGQATASVFHTLFQGSEEEFPWRRPKDDLCLGRARKALIYFLKYHGRPSQQPGAGFSIGLCRSVHTALSALLSPNPLPSATSPLFSISFLNTALSRAMPVSLVSSLSVLLCCVALPVGWGKLF
jgi:hypothetical protein